MKKPLTAFVVLGALTSVELYPEAVQLPLPYPAVTETSRERDVRHVEVRDVQVQVEPSGPPPGNLVAFSAAITGQAAMLSNQGT